MSVTPESVAKFASQVSDSVAAQYPKVDYLRQVIYRELMRQFPLIGFIELGDSNIQIDDQNRETK